MRSCVKHICTSMFSALGTWGQCQWDKLFKILVLKFMRILFAIIVNRYFLLSDHYMENK